MSETFSGEFRHENDEQLVEYSATIAPSSVEQAAEIEIRTARAADGAVTHWDSLAESRVQLSIEGVGTVYDSGFGTDGQLVTHWDGSGTVPPDAPSGQVGWEAEVTVRREGGNDSPDRDLWSRTHSGTLEIIEVPDESELRAGATSISTPDENRIEASIEVENVITSGGGESLSTTASYSGASSDSQSATIAPGETVRFEFEETDVEAGEYDVSVSAAGGSASETVEVTTSASELIVRDFEARGSDSGRITAEVRVTNRWVSGDGEVLTATAEYDGVESASETAEIDPRETVFFEFEETDVEPGVYDVTLSVAGETFTDTVSTFTITDELGEVSFVVEGDTYTVTVGDPVASNGGVGLTWAIDGSGIQLGFALEDAAGNVVAEDDSVAGVGGFAPSTGTITATSEGDFTFVVHPPESPGAVLGEIPVTLAVPDDPDDGDDADDGDDDADDGADDPDPDPDAVEPSVDAACDFDGAEINVGGSVTIPVDVTAGDGDTSTEATVEIEVAGQTASETVTLEPNGTARVEATYEISDSGEYTPEITLS